MKRLLQVTVLLLLAARGLNAATLHVSAAASLTDALTEIGKQYQKETADTVLFNFGASSMLARQIVEGAPADVFVSADEAKMDDLQQRDLINRQSRRAILSNTLVIVVRSDSKLAMKGANDLTSDAIRNIAIADPQGVPAGIYAKEYLTRLGLWAKLQPKFVPTDNVRSALAAVESGNADAGIVYKTDAMISKSVRVGWEVPLAEGPAISYPAAIVTATKEPVESRKFLDYLSSDRAKKIFKQFGFLFR